MCRILRSLCPKGILLNISGGSDLKLFEVNEAAEIIRNSSSPDANIIFGAVIDENMKDQIKVTIIATGFKDKVVDKSLKRDKTGDKEDSMKKTDELDKSFLSKEKSIFNAEKISENDFNSMDDDYLDIPTFLRKGRQ